MIETRRRVLGSLLVLGVLLAEPLALHPPVVEAGDVRLVVPGFEGEAAGEASSAERELDRILAKAGFKEEAALEAQGGLDAAALGSAGAVLLDRRSVAVLSRGGGTAVAALEGAVRRGAGLVAVGEAADALSGAERLSRLLGRKAITAAGEARPLEGPITLEIPDQSHPVTQCVTALHFSRARALHGGGPGTTALALATGPDKTALVWTRSEERGRVAVLSLAGASTAREKAALAFLAARAVEWAAGSPTTVRIPEEMPLAVERLGPEDAGLLPGLGLPAAEGFYRGRQIAPVMGFQGADWLLRKDREETEQPERVLDSLAIAEGSTVADIGAGTGYFSLRLARRVGPSGKVLATDIQEEMLRLLRERIEKEGVKNVEPILSTETDPRLPEGSVDLELMVDVYHELSRPAETLAALRRSLKARGPGADGANAGRLVLVEYRGEDPTVPIKPLHRTTVQQVRAEIEPKGFKLLEVKGFLAHQHVLVFERK